MKVFYENTGKTTHLDIEINGLFISVSYIIVTQSLSVQIENWKSEYIKYEIRNTHDRSRYRITRSLVDIYFV